MATTQNRVPENTNTHVNQQIYANTLRRVRLFADQPGSIKVRLDELAMEWDIERVIELNASSLAFIGVVLGFFSHPYWLLLPALVTAFLFQHAVQGWFPPIPLLRRLGFRTAHEIEAERNALKALRGDYQSIAVAEDRAAIALKIAHQ